MTKPRPSEDGKRIIFQDPERCRGCGLKEQVAQLTGAVSAATLAASAD